MLSGWLVASVEPTGNSLFTFISTKTIYTQGGVEGTARNKENQCCDGKNRQCLVPTEGVQQHFEARGEDVRGGGCWSPFVLVSHPSEERERAHQQAGAKQVAKRRQVRDRGRVGVDLEPPQRVDHYVGDYQKKRQLWKREISQNHGRPRVDIERT